MSPLEASIRDVISRYLAGLITVDDLNDALPDGWDVDEANDPRAGRLTMRVVGLLAGYQSGDRSESELRAKLQPEASWVVIQTADFDGEVINSERPETEVRADAGTPLPAELVS